MEVGKMSRLFTDLSRSILDAEEKALITDDFSDITINDIHVIDAIGRGEGKPSSAVAASLHVTMGTLTKAIDGLVRKSYVQRGRSDSDRRLVLLSLLPKGQSVYDRHSEFHERMMQAALSQFAPEETAFLERSLSDIQKYFVRKGDCLV